MGSNVTGPRPDNYEMPKVYVGQTVLWSYNTGGEVSPAIVVSVGSRSVCLHVHVKDVKDHVIKTGSRHVSDPFLVKFPQHDGGCWRFTEFDQLVLDRLSTVESYLEECEKAADVEDELIVPEEEDDPEYHVTADEI